MRYLISSDVRGYIKKSEYVKFDVEFCLHNNGNIYLTYDRTRGHLISKKCVKIEYLHENDIRFGIRMYVVEYNFIIWKKIKTIDISFSEQFKADINLLEGKRNHLTYKEFMQGLTLDDIND